MLRQASGIKYLNKMSTYHLACGDNTYSFNVLVLKILSLNIRYLEFQIYLIFPYMRKSDEIFFQFWIGLTKLKTVRNSLNKI